MRFLEDIFLSACGTDSRPPPQPKRDPRVERLRDATTESRQRIMDNHGVDILDIVSFRINGRQYTAESQTPVADRRNFCARLEAAVDINLTAFLTGGASVTEYAATVALVLHFQKCMESLQLGDDSIQVLVNGTYFELNPNAYTYSGKNFLYPQYYEGRTSYYVSSVDEKGETKITHIGTFLEERRKKPRQARGRG